MGSAIFTTWKHDNSGTTAIEFSLLAIPFVFTVISVVELAMYFASSSMMEDAVQSSSRLIKTGQLQGESAEDALESFLDEVCNQAGTFLDCDDFQYQVEKLDDFNDDISVALDEEGDLEDDGTFEIEDITSGCTALVRLVYPYEFITPIFGDLWGEFGNVRTIISTTVFQVEPYDLDDIGANCSV